MNYGGKRLNTYIEEDNYILAMELLNGDTSTCLHRSVATLKRIKRFWEEIFGGVAPF